MFINVHSYYSLRYGTHSIKELLAQMEALGLSCAVLTDINNSTGAMEFIRACRASKQHIKPLVGIEFRRGSELLYWGIARSKEGMRHLNTFLSEHNLHQMALPQQAPILQEVFFVYPFCKDFKAALPESHYVGLRATQLNQLYKHPLLGQQEKLLCWHPVSHAGRVGFRIHQHLRAIDQNCLLTKLSPADLCQEDEVFISEAQLREAYALYPFLLANTQELLDYCDLKDYVFEKGSSKNKIAYTKRGVEGDRQMLRNLTFKGLTYRYGHSSEKARQRIEKELKIIEQKRFCGYFLITFDIIRYAIEQCGFYHVGRGSGANSLVAYCLRITDVDPLALDLYFERFLNEKRSNPPDFDIDFSWDERPVIQEYIFRRYPLYHVALLGTVSTFKDRAILREMGKVWGLAKTEMDDLLDPAQQDQRMQNPVYQKLIKLHAYIQGYPNQRSIHAGGILISEEPITYYSALDLPPKGLPTVQWDMYEAEEMGYEKFDILSQRGLGHIRESVEWIYKNRGVQIDIHDFKNIKQDVKVNTTLKAGQPIGCFYIESPAMRQLLKKLKCDNYLTLVAASSIIRPGVASSGMMKSYIERYHAPDKVKYLHPVMEAQLKETYGVMVYQEDVIKVCHYFAGLGLAESDLLRKAMSGKYRSKLAFEALVEQFFASARAQGHPQALIEEVWRQISSFAGYSFSKAHSASFAVESYQSLYLKTYFPMEFMVSVLNNYGGFYRRWVYIEELKKTGATVHLPCINRSMNRIIIQGKDCWLGLSEIQSLAEKSIQKILSEREKNGAYLDLPDFVHRSQLGLEQCLLLIRINAFRSWGIEKRVLFWSLYTLLGQRTPMAIEKPLFKMQHKALSLPPLEHNQLEDAYLELELLGYPLQLSYFDLLKTNYRGDWRAQDLPQMVGQEVRMLGLYVCEKTVRTLQGKKMWFGTFLDVAGDFFDTVHFPAHSPYYPFRGPGCYLMRGRVVEDFGFASIEVRQFAKLPLKANPIGD